MTEIVYITRVILSSQSHSHVIYVTPKARLMFVQNAGRPLKFIMAASMTWDAKHMSCNRYRIQEEKQARNAIAVLLHSCSQPEHAIVEVGMPWVLAT